MSPKRFEDRATTPTSVLDVLDGAAYRAVLDEPSLDTVILTAYPLVDYGAGPDDINLLRPWTAREQEIETRQTTELCEWLFTNYGESGKTIVIANSEADEKLREIADYTGDLSLAAANLTAWTVARHEAITNVRRRYPRARLRLLHAFEISMVNLRVVEEGARFRKGQAPPTTSARKATNALESVVPHVPFDLLSYSSYEAANSPYQTGNIHVAPADTSTRISRDIATIQHISANSVSTIGKREFPRNYVMIGEIGFARDRFESLPTGGVLARFDAALDAAVEQSCPFFTIWQTFDAPRDGRAAWGFGALDRRGRHPKLRRSRDGAETLGQWARQSAAN